MKEFIDKLIERLEEAKASANRRNAFDSVVSYAFSINIVNKLAEEYINCSTDTSTKSNDCSTKVLEIPTGWIPCSSGVMPKVLQWVLIQTTQGDMDVIRYIGEEECWGNDFYHRIHPRKVIAWQPLPAPYQPKGENELYRAKSVDGDYQEYKGDWK